MKNLMDVLFGFRKKEDADATAAFVAARKEKSLASQPGFHINPEKESTLSASSKSFQKKPRKDSAPPKDAIAIERS